MNRRRRSLAGFFAALLGGLLLSAGTVAQTLPPGYAVDRPAVLTRQLLWGQAHGIRLLALACRDAGHGRAMEAYLRWLDSQGPALAELSTLLSKMHFGVMTASPEQLAQALGLKARLDLAPERLAEACASLPEALAGSRHDLAAQLKVIEEH